MLFCHLPFMGKEIEGQRHARGIHQQQWLILNKNALAHKIGKKTVSTFLIPQLMVALSALCLSDRMIVRCLMRWPHSTDLNTQGHRGELGEIQSCLWGPRPPRLFAALLVSSYLIQTSLPTFCFHTALSETWIHGSTLMESHPKVYVYVYVFIETCIFIQELPGHLHLVIHTF